MQLFPFVCQGKKPSKWAIIVIKELYYIILCNRPWVLTGLANSLYSLFQRLDRRRRRNCRYFLHTSRVHHKVYHSSYLDMLSCSAGTGREKRPHIVSINIWASIIFIKFSDKDRNSRQNGGNPANEKALQNSCEISEIFGNFYPQFAISTDFHRFVWKNLGKFAQNA